MSILVLWAILVLGSVACGGSEPPMPTPTFLPAPTPDCDIFAAEEYLFAMGEVGEGLNASYQEIGRLDQMAIRAPSLWHDDKWKNDMMISLSSLRQYSSQFFILEPPPSLAHIHAINLEMADAIEDMVIAYGTGIERADEDLRDEAIAHQLRVDDLLGLSTQKIDEYDAAVAAQCG